MSLAGILFVMQREQDTDHAMQSCQGVADADADPDGYAAGFSGQMPQATHGLGHDAKAGSIFVGASLTVTTDAQHNQSRICFQQILGIESPSFHGARSKVFNEHVGFAGQTAHDILAFLASQIQR